MRRFHALIIAAATCAVANAQSTVPATYWPGERWRTATPESRGIDSQALASAIEQVRQKQWGVHSLLVIRHGYVVADVDFYPYTLAIRFTPEHTMEVTADEASGLIRNGRLVGTPAVK